LAAIQDKSGAYRLSGIVDLVVRVFSDTAKERQQVPQRVTVNAWQQRHK